MCASATALDRARPGRQTAALVGLAWSVYPLHSCVANGRALRRSSAIRTYRLILPFGLNVKNGDVISVAGDGTFSIEGSTWSQLNMDPGRPRPPTASGDLCRISSDGSTYRIRAAGEASTLFPQLPSGAAGVDIHFNSEDGWLLAIPSRELLTLPDINRFRQPILNAYGRGTWQLDWALVYEVARAERMTLLAATARDTDIALSISGEVAPQVVDSVKLISGVFVAQTSRQIIQWIQRDPGPVACRALRVRDSIWRFWERRTVTTLGRDDEVLRAADDEFWEDATPGRHVTR